MTASQFKFTPRQAEFAARRGTVKALAHVFGTVVLLSLVLPPPWAAAMERVQQASATTPAGATSLSLAWPAPTEDGNFLVLAVHVRWNLTVGNIGIPAGWTLAERADNIGFRKITVALYYREAVPSQSGTVTVTALNAEDRIKMVLAEYRGMRTSGSLDQHAQSVGSSVAPTSGTSAPTMQPEELWLGSIANDAGFDQCGPTNSFVQVAMPTSGASTLGLYERVAAANGTAGLSVTLRLPCGDTSMLSSEWAGVVATFRAVSAAGDILVADQFFSGGAIIRVDPSTGAQTTVSSDASFATPRGVAVDANGDVLVADFGDLLGGGGVIRVDRATGAQTTVSSGGSFAGAFSGPNGIALEASGDIVVTDPLVLGGAPGLLRIDPSTGAQSVVSSGGSFSTPWGLTVDSNGDILLADQDADAVIRVNPSTGAQTTVSSGGSFEMPRGIALDANGDILVVDSEAFGGSGGVIRVNPSTGAQTTVSSGGSFVEPNGLAVAANGDIFVVDTSAGGFGTSAVIRVNPSTGSQTAVSLGGSLEYSVGITIDPFPAPTTPTATPVSTTPTVTPTVGPLTGEQARCVSKVNNDARRVLDAATRKNVRCVRRGSGDVTGCIDATDEKTRRRKAKLVAHFNDRCSPLPPFGVSSDPNVIATAAEQVAKNVVHTLFGTTVSVTAGDRCAEEVVQRAGQLAVTRWRVFRQCKKDGIDGFRDGTDLVDACVNGPGGQQTDPRGKIALSKQKLEDSVATSCANFSGLGDPCNAAANPEAFAACVDAQVACEVCAAISAADGLTSDCDRFDDGSLNASCGTPSSTATATHTPTPTATRTPTSETIPCATLPAPSLEPLNSTCRQSFPPSSGIPCAIATPGTQYYVDAATGSDSNSGISPAQAWATLCKAVQAAPADSTIRVATGVYTTASVVIDKPITVKGGYDSAFATWDPDLYPTTFAGSLTLDDDGAVFGGFRMTSRPASSRWCDRMHAITAGTLVGNYVEIVYTSLSDSTQCAQLIEVRPAAGAVATLACNDIYVRGESAQYALGTTAVELYALGGDVMLDSNRICLDNYANKWFAETVSGYGTCGSGTSTSTLTLTNNIIENAASGYAVGSFYGCGHDLNMVLTNNTVVTNGAGITGYAGESGGVVRWKLTNNIVARLASGSGSGIRVGANPGVVISSADGNLVFGFSDNGITPAPETTWQNDTSGSWTPSQVFVDAAQGNFHLRPGGAGVGTGLNVYNLPVYGSVTVDLDQFPRPALGAWDRGAFKY